MLTGFLPGTGQRYIGEGIRRLKKIYFIDDQVRTGEFWVMKCRNSQWFSGAIHFLSPMDFENFLDKGNSLESGSYIVTDRKGPGFDTSEGFVSAIREKVPQFNGKFILVSSSFDPGKCPIVEGFDGVFCKREALSRIEEMAKKESCDE